MSISHFVEDLVGRPQASVAEVSGHDRDAGIGGTHAEPKITEAVYEGSALKISIPYGLLVKWRAQVNSSRGAKSYFDFFMAQTSLPFFWHYTGRPSRYRNEAPDSLRPCMPGYEKI